MDFLNPSAHDQHPSFEHVLCVQHLVYFELVAINLKHDGEICDELGMDGVHRVFCVL